MERDKRIDRVQGVQKDIDRLVLDGLETALNRPIPSRNVERA